METGLPRLEVEESLLFLPLLPSLDPSLWCDFSGLRAALSFEEALLKLLSLGEEREEPLSFSRRDTDTFSALRSEAHSLSLASLSFPLSAGGETARRNTGE